MKKTPFTDAEVRAIDTFLGVDDEKSEVARLYTPLDAPADKIYQRLLTAPDVRAVYAAGLGAYLMMDLSNSINAG